MSSPDDPRQSKRTLFESEARFHQAFEHTSSGMAFVDLDGVYIDVNPAFAALFGYERHEIVGQRRLMHADEGERRRTQRHMADVLAGRVVAARFDARGRTKSGEEVFTTLSTTVVRDPDDAPLYYLVQVQDNTEGHRARAELARQQARALQAQKLEALGRLAGGVAHDFNNLLTVILTATDQLATHTPADDKSVAAIRRASSRAADLTHQLLAFGRRQVLQDSVVDLGSVIVGLHDLLRRLIGEDIEVDMPADAIVWRTRVDPAQLERVIANLAVNARDAMPEGGRLTILLHNLEVGHPAAPDDSQRHVCVEVSDTGRGMATDVSQRIFEPFYTTKADGTGLGLAMVYGVVQQSGGTVTVHSVPDEGTRFVLTFPATDDPLAVDPATGPIPDVVVGGPETVLLAEDDADIRVLLTEALGSMGYTVIAADDGESAVALARDAPRVDLVLTDIVMPGRSGPAAVAEIRLLHPRAKVLFMTGYAEDDERWGAHPRHSPVLRKPFTLAALDAHLRALLGPQ